MSDSFENDFEDWGETEADEITSYALSTSKVERDAIIKLHGNCNEPIGPQSIQADLSIFADPHVYHHFSTQ
jgi:porphobilinogen deaminase